MKRIGKSALALLMVLLMLFDVCQSGIAVAAEEVDRASTLWSTSN